MKGNDKRQDGDFAPMQRLPDAEFAVMRAVWESPEPVTAAVVMKALEGEKSWKTQTVITLLTRLTERGFLRTEKAGRERGYYPLIDREQYLAAETDSFLRQYHNSSLRSLVSALYQGKALPDKDVEELLDWVKEHRD